MICLIQLDTPFPFQPDVLADGIIVVVEDDAETALMLQDVIETGTPYQALLLQTPNEALRRLEDLAQLKLALLLLDYVLPQMSGIELYDRLRASSARGDPRTLPFGSEGGSCVPASPGRSPRRTARQAVAPGGPVSADRPPRPAGQTKPVRPAGLHRRAIGLAPDERRREPVNASMLTRSTVSQRPHLCHRRRVEAMREGAGPWLEQ